MCAKQQTWVDVIQIHRFPTVPSRVTKFHFAMLPCALLFDNLRQKTHMCPNTHQSKACGQASSPENSQMQEELDVGSFAQPQSCRQRFANLQHAAGRRNIVSPLTNPLTGPQVRSGSADCSDRGYDGLSDALGRRQRPARRTNAAVSSEYRVGAIRD